MIYKESIEGLLDKGVIRKCPVDDKTISNLIRRAFKDISTAKTNLARDEDCAYTYAYTAMLRCGLAFMAAMGFRPEASNKHEIVIKFAASILEDEYPALLNDYDFMRRKRNRLIYEPDLPCSRKEASEAIKTADEFVSLIIKALKKKNPQLELDL
jgi:uncharacterized protein (UPF0332 family)